MFTIIKIRCDECFDDHEIEVNYDYFPADKSVGEPEQYSFYPEDSKCACGRVFTQEFIKNYILRNHLLITQEIKNEFL